VVAEQYFGYNEYTHRQELKTFTGIDPVKTEWCAAFVNAVLAEQGILGSKSVSDNPLMARSFLNWGEKVSKTDIQPGDLVVFPRGPMPWNGHVGFYVSTTKSNSWVILGGNQSKQVKYDLYIPSTAIAIRRQPVQ